MFILTSHGNTIKNWREDFGCLGKQEIRKREKKKENM